MLRSQDSLQIWRVKSVIVVRFGSSVFRQVIGIPIGELALGRPAFVLFFFLSPQSKQ